MYIDTYTAVQLTVHVLSTELGTNPLKSSGIENGAFQGMKRLSYIRIADTNITSIPKGKNFSKYLTDLHKCKTVTSSQLGKLKKWIN